MVLGRQVEDMTVHTWELDMLVGSIFLVEDNTGEADTL